MKITPVRIGPTWQVGDDGQFVLPERTLGWQIIAWIEAWLRSPDGSPWSPTPEQRRWLLWWYAVDDRGRFLSRRGVFQRLKGHGKDPLAAAVSMVEFVGPCRFSHWATEDDLLEHDYLELGDPVAVDNPAAWIQVAAVSKDQPLALDTRVRTPDGWTTVEKLGVGDYVYDERGRPQLVRRETEVFNDLDCYRLTFDDGQQVVASAEHGWTVERKRLRGDYHVQENLTTRELAEGYLDTKGGRRVRIPVVAVESPDVELPIDPYLLGLWLGDGNRHNGSIAIDWRVRGEVEEILTPLLGEHERLTFTYIVNETGVVNVRNVSRHAANGPALIQRLRDLGVLRDKHVPDRYAFAGTEQRRALLQGLIDSDGCVLPDGQVRFTNVDRGLIEDVRDLVASLGYKAHVRPHGTAGWIVGFRPDERPVARLRHKACRQRPWGKPQPRYRYLERVERVDRVPVKCIGIDTPSHLFQVEGGVLTQNTRNTMTIYPSLVSPALKAAHAIDLGKEIIYAYHGARRIEAVTSSPRALEGGRPTFVIQNETHHWLENNEGHAMAAVIDRNSTKAKGGQARTLSITNAYEPSENSVAQQEREAYEAEASGQAIATGVLYDSLEAPPDALLRPKGDPTEDEVRAYISAVIEAVRGDATWLDVEGIVNSILDRRNPPSQSRRFWYNQVVAAENAWLDPRAVDLAVDPLVTEIRRTTEDQLRAGWIAMRDEPIVMFLDCSKSDDATALVGCRLSDGFVITFGVWAKPPGDAGKGWVVSRESVDSRVHEVMERFNVVAFWGDPSHTKDEDSTRFWDSYFDRWHRQYQTRLQVWAVKSGVSTSSIMWDMTSPERTRQFVGAAEAFADEIQNEGESGIEPMFLVDGHPALVEHLKNARRYPMRDGVSLWKGHRESRRKIDLAVCAVGARMLRRIVLNQKAEEPEQDKAGELWGAWT